MSYTQLQIFGTAKVLLSSLNSRYSIRESENIIRILIEEVTGKTYPQIKASPEICFTEAQFQRWQETSQRLINGLPLQYALGKAWFIDLELEVGPGVLIPRPETEELADLACKTAQKIQQDPRRQQKSQGLRILDIGTGSGCIAVYLARQLPMAKVIANDISETALSTAQKNASIYKVSITPFLQDILKAEKDQLSHLDLIVTNPPYIPEAEKAEMDPLVVENEPDLALFVPDHDPLLFYQQTAILGKEWLQPWGSILCETHENLAQETAAIFQHFGYQGVEILRDLQGRERMVRAFVQIA